MANDILLYVENARDGSGYKKAAAELATAGRALAGDSNGQVVALVTGGIDEAGKAMLAAHGVDKLLHVDGEAFGTWTLEAHAAALETAARALTPRAVLLTASTAGKELGPYVAARLGLGFVSDVTAIHAEGEGIQVTKPRYAGKAVATIHGPGAAVISVRPNSIPQEPNPREPAVEALAVEAPAPRVTTLDVQASGEKTIELTEADIVVSGGRGLGGSDNWHLVTDLAAALGAAHGASRAVVDAGWRPHAEQVGQTGKVVAPKLYIACGISGAIQHLAGMSSSKVIIAVNKDPDAPIFKVADYGIVGDVNDVLPMLTAAVKDFA